MIISFILAGIVIILDQLTKFLIYGTPARSIIGNLLWFQSTLNTGIAFSMFENLTWLFSIISAISSGIFVFLIINKNIIKNRSGKIILGIILGGTIGNLIDRIIYGGVRDFIYLKFMDIAIVNIADIAVTIGAIVFCVYLLIFEIFNAKNTNIEINEEEKLDNKTEPIIEENDNLEILKSDMIKDTLLEKDKNDRGN